MKKVIFDVDGVLLSEKRYFDVSALVLWEWYNSPAYMGFRAEKIQPLPNDAKIAALRDFYWQHDKILAWLKGHGVNSNWDMVHAHIVTTLWLLLERYIQNERTIDSLKLQTNEDIVHLGKLLQGYVAPDAAVILQRLSDTVPEGAGKDDVFSCLSLAIAQSLGSWTTAWTSLDSALWQLHFQCFQEWYFGDVLYEGTYGQKPYAPGKDGFLRHEEPLGDSESIREMFKELKRRGYRIAIATGRSRMEMQVPFETYGWLAEFDPYYICTDTEVVAAENQLQASLGKPNPFVYYVGAFGNDPARYKDYVEHPDEFKQGNDYYVVGDSLADVWCAKEMKATMIGTLTGLEGAAARPMFEKEGVTHVVATVLDILQILK